LYFDHGSVVAADSDVFTYLRIVDLFDTLI